MSTPGGGFLRGLIAGAILTLLLLITVAPVREAVLPDVAERDQIDEALELIERSYFEDPDIEELERASIRGMVRELRRENDDRFSHYFDPETFERFTSATSGEFSGIGTNVQEAKRGLEVIRVFEDAPAEEVGLAPGDLIVSVDGESIAGESATGAAAKIQGEPGTEVELGVVDAETEKRRSYEVERARVKIPAVESRIEEAGGIEIGYVQLATFSEGAHGELRDEIMNLYRKGAEALVLDLRGNGGGLVQEAILVTSIFLEDGPVLRTEGRTREPETFQAVGDALDPKPTVVLVNDDTASASEIVAAALKQNDLATVVGTKTFGKGTFQEVIELTEAGGALDLTVGEYLTADGSSIAGKGVKPDVKVKPADGSKQDRQLDRALELLRDELGS